MGGFGKKENWDGCDPDEVKQAIEASKGTEKAEREARKKAKSRIEVLSFPRMHEVLMEKHSGAAEFLKLDKMEVEVILDNKKIIRKLNDNDGQMARDTKIAANAERMTDELSYAYLYAAMPIAEAQMNGDEVDDGLILKQTQEFKKAVEICVQEATMRANDALVKLSGIRVKYRNYKIKSGAKLTLTVVGTFAAASTLVLTPFAGPAMVITAIGVFRGISNIARDIVLLSEEAEDTIKVVQANVKKLVDTYNEETSKFAVGTMEVAKAFANSTLGLEEFTNSISDNISQCGTIDSKINGIVVKAGNQYKLLNDTLDIQEKSDRILTNWLEANTQHIVKSKVDESPDQALLDKLASLQAKVKSISEKVVELIEVVPQLEERASTARDHNDILKDKLAKLSKKKTKVAVFTELFITNAANVGFLVAGNVGFPDAYAVTATANAIAGITGTSADTVGGAWALSEDIIGLSEEVDEAVSAKIVELTT